MIADCNSNDKKGLFNAVHNRIKYLSNYKDLDIDVYLIQEYETWPIRKMKKTNKRIKETDFIYDGVKYKNLWKNFYWNDYARWNSNRIIRCS